MTRSGRRTGGDTLEGLAGARLSGAGNRFVLVDALRGPAPADAAGLARACAGDPFRPDGLLVLDRAPDGALRMAVYNRDGSRPEACGNGLSCVARYAVAAGHAAAGTFAVHTDAGRRTARVDADAAHVSMGRARLGAPETLRVEGTTLETRPVDVGNPHLVVVRDALRDEELPRWGPLLSAARPGGANVELVAVAGGRLEARVWERGVGETAACGSGACAAAAVAVDGGALGWPVRVAMPGGVLEVDRGPDGELWLASPVEIGALLGATRA